MKALVIKDISGAIYKFDMDQIAHYDLEFTFSIIRIDRIDNSFIEFMRSNVIFVGTISDSDPICES